MSRIVYVDGIFRPEGQAFVSVFDRGFLFGDGVYEVTAVVDGKLIDCTAHMERLGDSLEKCGIPFRFCVNRLLDTHQEMVDRNRLNEGLVYIQITRGVADRALPCQENMQPTVVLFTQEKQIVDTPHAREGIRVVTVPDIRWQRRDIKSISLLAQVMSRKIASEAGRDEAWMLDERGSITEGSSSNAFIVNNAGHLVTRPPKGDILAGTTRSVILELAGSAGLRVDHRAFSLEEAYGAREAFNTSAGTFVMPVIAVNERLIADGVPGNVTRKLRSLYIERLGRMGIAA